MLRDGASNDCQPERRGSGERGGHSSQTPATPSLTNQTRPYEPSPSASNRHGAGARLEQRCEAGAAGGRRTERRQHARSRTRQHPATWTGCCRKTVRRVLRSDGDLSLVGRTPTSDQQHQATSSDQHDSDLRNRKTGVGSRGRQRTRWLHRVERSGVDRHVRVQDQLGSSAICTRTGRGDRDRSSWGAGRNRSRDRSHAIGVSDSRTEDGVDLEGDRATRRVASGGAGEIVTDGQRRRRARERRIAVVLRRSASAYNQHEGRKDPECRNKLPHVHVPPAVERVRTRNCSRSPTTLCGSHH